MSGASVFGETSSNLSSSFPGAVKSIQLLQLQNRHCDKVRRQDTSQEFINCNIDRVSSSEECATQTNSCTEKGIVKWYNDRKQYGFITNLTRCAANTVMMKVT